MPAHAPNYELAAVGAEEHIARLGPVSQRDGRVAQRTQVAAAVEREAGVVGPPALPAVPALAT